MEKVSDFIARRLSELGVSQVFMVTGGGAMHLNDSFSHREGIGVVYCHHEQACAIAAEGAYRASGRVACVNVTTGPGGLNALNGVLGQWTDSIPAIYISGQVKFETTIGSCPEIGLRQLGDQEVDIVSIVRPITKYAAQVRDPREIRREIDKAFRIAMSARMGPVWLDIPMNVQGAPIDTDQLPADEEATPESLDSAQPGLADEVIRRLGSAKRPLLVLGHGIRLAGVIEEASALLKLLKIPAVTTFNGFDLIEDEHPNYIGRIGTLGTRAGNFALQNADAVLILGSRNNVRQASYNWKDFAHRAFKIIVDIDAAELAKPTVVPDLAVNMDLRDFLPSALASARRMGGISRPDWLAWCRERRELYPVLAKEELDDRKGINPYAFFDAFSRQLPAGSISVAGNGTACVCLFQAGIVGKGTRHFWNSGCASMGYDLPAALGAAVATRSPVFCFAGDGSLQMNIQELQTLVTNRLPVKIIYLNNDGYVSIKQTQDNFFKRRAGCDAASGVETPNMEKLASAYGIGYLAVRKLADCPGLAGKLLSIDGPVIAEIFLQKDYIFMPKLSSEKLPDGRMVSKPLEDMYPFLSRDEYLSNMISE